MSKHEPQFVGKYAASVFETLKFSYNRHVLSLVLLFLLGFLGRILLLSNANIIGYWVDSFCKTAESSCRPLPGLFSTFSNQDFIALLTVVTTLGFLLTAAFRIIFSRVSCVAVSDLYDEVTLRTSRVPMSFFDRTPVGVIMTRFSSDYGNVFRLFGGPLAEFCVIIFDLVSMLLLVTLAGVWYLPLVGVIAVLNYAVYRLNKDKLRQERRELSTSRGPSVAHFAETTQGASTIRVYSRKESFKQRFKLLNNKFLKHRLSATKASINFSYQMNALSALLFLLTGLLGIYLARKAQVSIGSIGVAFTFIAFSTSSVQMFFQWMAQFEEAMTGVERLDHYLRMPLENGSVLPRAAEFPTGHPVRTQEELAARPSSSRSLGAEVRFENVSFRYSPHGPKVLDNINFTIRPGERVGIVGRTGSGKSSLIQALFHLYPLESGTIWLDHKTPRLEADRPLKPHEIDLEFYRRSIALIAQEPTLFRGTLRDNLCLGQTCDEKAVREALEHVGLWEWVSQTKDGLDLHVEERGKNFSLGERQLFCMARCLLQQAPLIVLDEATSAIDPQTEKFLVEATDKFFKGRTQIIIAHRLSTLKSCDRILILEQGRFTQSEAPLTS